ncbi:unnamed protein product [Cuscuta europaea]|uniref:Retroviral polymerase SH3-like domain-containing protein n=1 Tax=Cuscuta europaea TaxID=41803 RepID=A0A9P1EL31_CUSEU|nr:unnamed protein product [Cuscuta europaea]CAH9114027.1 unnamed protein product [Cuscuta europaea]
MKHGIKKTSGTPFQKNGCIDYSHITSQLREKFDEKGENLIFVGYSDESKGYRLLDPKTNKLTISRDVTFDEKAVWNGKNDQHAYVTHPPPLLSTSDQPSASENPCVGSPEHDQIHCESESPVQKVRSLADIYNSCDVAFVALFSSEPHGYEEVGKQEIWQKAMDEEIMSILKKQHMGAG